MNPYAPSAGLGLPALEAAWLAQIKGEATRKRAITAFIKEIKETMKKSFASLANAYFQSLNETSLQLASLDGDLENQLILVRSLVELKSSFTSRMEACIESDEKCANANIEDNEFTIYSIEDLKFEFEIIYQALNKKEAFIENQIVARGKSNITPEQMESYDEFFDQDASNNLSRDEFRAALKAEGHPYGESEFDKIFAKATGGMEVASFEQFIDFIKTLEEDKTTPEQLAAAFSQLAHEKDYITDTDLFMGQALFFIADSSALGKDVVNYLKESMPLKADTNGYDFKEYLKQVFSRAGRA